MEKGAERASVWIYKLGGVGSQSVTRVRWMVLSKLMENSDLVPTCTCQLCVERVQ